MKRAIFLFIAAIFMVSIAGAQSTGAVRGDRDRLLRSLSKSELTSIVSKLHKKTDATTTASCLLNVYVDDSGNDANAGDTPATAKKTIQAGIDAACAGGTVHVYPGAYSETATNRFVLGVNGPHQFGLFIDKAMTIQGVDGSGTPITSYSSVLAEVVTNATNNFGYSGIFVEGDGVKIQGVKILPNVPEDNKTIEVIGDNFTLKYCHLAIPVGGSVYFNDWQFNTGTNTSHLQSYNLDGNWLDMGTSIDLASGAGFSGLASGRLIKNNKFTNSEFWPSISFNGSDTGVPWFVYSVGGAVITGNNFTNTYNTVDVTSGHIRARGTYDNTQFDWNSYWSSNTFNKAVVTAVGAYPPITVRTYSYPGFYGTYNNVRRIGVTIQGEVDNASTNDQVLIAVGIYSNPVSINKNDLTLQGAGIGQTKLQGDGTTCTTAGIAFSGSRSGITIADMSITGWLDGIQMFTGPLSNVLIEDVEASNNCRHGIWSQAFGINGLTVRRVTASSNNALPNAAQSGRGIWIINGVKQNIVIENGFFNNNRLVGIDVSDGNVTGLTISGNEVKGNGDSGIGVLGAQGPGANLITNNTVMNNGRFGIEIKNPTGNGASSGAGSVVVLSNNVSRTVAATDLRDHCGIGVFRRFPVLADNADQPSGVFVKQNAVTGYRRAAVGATGDGFGIVIEGSNHTVDGNTVTNNDVGIQMQAGNPSINAQNTAYFDRGDATPTSNALLIANTVNTNAYGIRSIGAVTGSLTQNIIHDNTVNGVTILDEASTGVVANNNQICTNQTFGFENLGTTTVNATNNWWGEISGPTHVSNPGGTGDAVSDRVSFTPFDDEGPSSGPCPGPAKPIVFLADKLVKITQNKESDGDIYSNNDIEFGTGTTPGKHTGNLTAVDDVTLKSKNTIVGNVTAGDEVERSSNVTITGTVTEDPSTPMIPLPTLSFSAGGADVTVSKNGTRALAPGSYDEVELKEKATLNLRAGDYFFNELSVGKQAKLSINVSGGPVNINVVCDLFIDEKALVNVIGGSTALVTFSSRQDDDLVIGKGATMRGTIIAPEADLHFLADSKFRGAATAETIILDAKVKFQHHNSTAPFPKPSEVDASETVAEHVITDYVLEQNYPNPFNPTTEISFALPEAAKVKLHIFALNGQLVATLVDGELSAGRQQLRWNGRNASGKTVAAGIYLYRIVAQDRSGATVFTATKRMTFLK